MRYFSHMDVFDNIAFGLKIKKMDKETIKHKVNRMLDLVKVSWLWTKKYKSVIRWTAAASSDCEL